MSEQSLTRKTCKTCSVTKQLDQFSTNGKSGHHPHCKVCRSASERKRRDSDGDKIRAQERERYNSDPSAKRRSCRKYYISHEAAIKSRNSLLYQSKVDLRKLQAKDYRQRNPDRVREWNGTRRALLRRACPPWVNRDAIRAIYKEAAKLERETGICHHVDHIIPLFHKFVCGLHIPDNLQILTATENLKKSNRW